jgi:murein DD-endopeptidase MepM/ murein hydrolase activator NlpD
MRLAPWLIGGGALAYLWMRGKRSSVGTTSAPPPPTALAGRWVWPVPTHQGRRPVISDGFDSPRPGLPRHGGVDVMFARLASDPFKAGSPNGSKLFVMPDDIPALAASDGVVWSATQTPQGFAVVIDHGPRKVATFYTHLEKLLVASAKPGKNGERLRAGQPLGIIGASPRDSEHLKHLHFEIWLGGPSDRIDPSPVMRAWEFASDPPETLVARNAFLF